MTRCLGSRAARFRGEAAGEDLPSRLESMLNHPLIPARPGRKSKRSEKQVWCPPIPPTSLFAPGCTHFLGAAAE